jgi:uncharacterized protein DUF4375
MPPFRSRTVAFALSLSLAVTSLHAAPDDGTKPAPEKKPKSIMDLKIPIPAEPDAADNGCRLRQSPAEAETGALTEVPFWSLVEHDYLKFGIRIVIDGPEKLSRQIAALDEDARTLATLYVLWYSLGRDGLHTFFYVSDAAGMAPQIRDTLKTAGLSREYDVFVRAMALFGKDYPLDAEARKKFFGWSQPSTRVDAVTSIPAPLNAFDYRLIALSREFGMKATFKDTLTRWIAGRPALWQRIEARRARLNEPDRMAVLNHLLAVKSGGAWGPYPEVERRFTALGKPYRTLAIMNEFNDEFRNGGVHQFFYNSSGMLAPEVHEAMIELGMAEQAAIFKRGLDMFGKTYIRETPRRREAFFKHDGWNEWDKKLSALTDDLYALDGGLSFHRVRDSTVVEGGPGIDFAILRYTKQHKLLPC